jgi:phosphoenolpyruvate-protein kinase (PTS system EI component)
MALSQDAKNRLAVALTSLNAATEVIAALSTTLGSPAATTAVIAASTNIPAAACAGAATPSATQVNAAIDACNAVTEARLDTIEAKVNAIITALKGASLMAP